MFYAVLENGGKQYKAVEGETIEVDLLPEEVGKKKTFENVLLLVNDSETQVGSPFLDSVSIDCTVLEHFKGEKVTIFKYRAKQRFRVKTGHRQSHTRVVVDSIAFPGKSQAAKKSESAEEKVEAPVKKGRTKPTAAAKKPGKKTETKKTEAKKTEAKKTEKPKAKKETPSTSLKVEDLDLGTRANSALTDAGITKVGQLLKKLEGGEDALMDLPGVGSKTVDDIKKKLKKLGFELPKAK